MLGGSKENIKIIGIRHGERIYETLLTGEECSNAVDLGNFYRFPCDNRSLNYDKNFMDRTRPGLKINETVDTAVEMNQNGNYGIPVPDYTDENVSVKVVKIIQSYVDIINRAVWRKG